MISRAQTIRTFAARSFPVFRSVVMSKPTRMPSWSGCCPGTALTCTNTSLPPLSGLMNPNPLSLLNTFTIPVATSPLLSVIYPVSAQFGAAVMQACSRLSEYPRASEVCNPLCASICGPRSNRKIVVQAASPWNAVRATNAAALLKRTRPLAPRVSSADDTRPGVSTNSAPRQLSGNGITLAINLVERSQEVFQERPKLLFGEWLSQ